MNNKLLKVILMIFVTLTVFIFPARMEASREQVSCPPHSPTYS